MALKESLLAVSQEPTLTAAGVADAIPKFKPVDLYTTFKAEYFLDDGDYIIHFFLPNRAAEDSSPLTAQEGYYWSQLFPQVLSDTAEDYFKATKPRVMAQYVPEVLSWYMRANGFGQRLDPDGYLERFFKRLDENIDAAVALLSQPSLA